MRILTLLLLAGSLEAARPSLTAKITALIDAAPVTRTAFWGIEVRDCDSGVALVQRNERHLFIPASNTKLFTTALALTRLGADFHVQTVVTAPALPDAQGRVTGDLTLIGAGDANLSGRPIPYDMNAEKQDPLTAMRDLAAQLYAQGVRSVAGNVVGDDSRFVYEPYPPGWSIDDPVYSDGAPVSALTVNDNSIAISIDALRITFAPPLTVFTVENRILPGPSRKIHISREPGSTTLRLWGTMPPDDPGETDTIAVDDPARYAALALVAALQEKSITVSGNAVARHAYAGMAPQLPTPGITLAQRDSAPLLEGLRITDKVSQNLHAEMLLRQVGQGSRRNGLDALGEFVSQIGISPDDYSFADGSGLSRLNLVTPRAIVQLLVHMAKSPAAADFASLLPIAGVDGSLHLRFERSIAKGKVYAKTGSLSHTSALSGFAVRRNGHRLAFSILVNNYNGSTVEVRTVIDRICALLVE